MNTIQGFKPKRQQDEIWANLILLKERPIQHRSSKAEGKLSPFAYQLALVLWDQAREHWIANVNRASWQAGADKGSVQRAKEKQFARGEARTAVTQYRDKEMSAKQILAAYRGERPFTNDAPDQYKMRPHERIRLGYSKGNEEHRQDLLARGPYQEDLIFTVSKSHLLKVLGRVQSTKNRVKVIPAIEEIMAWECDHPPLLLGYKELPDGNLELTVNVKWLHGQYKAYREVRTPFPDKSHVLWLYCFVHVIRTDGNACREDRDKCNVGWLGASLELDQTRGPKNAQAKLDRALEALNQHVQEVQGVNIRYEVRPDSTGHAVKIVSKQIKTDRKLAKPAITAIPAAPSMSAGMKPYKYGPRVQAEMEAAEAADRKRAAVALNRQRMTRTPSMMAFCDDDH